MDPVARADLVWAWRALRAQPSVALVSLAAAGLQPLAWRLGAMARHPIAIALTTAIALASLAIAFGWYGAERTFFQSRRQNRAVTLQDLLALVPGFCGRFAALALLTGLPLFVLLYLIGFVFGTDPDGTLWLLPLANWAVLLALDARLTFVTPALAYTTRSVREAMDIGSTMIRATWPRSALYVLCPALAVKLRLALSPIGISWIGIAALVALVPLELVAKGAIAAFYLRERGGSANAATAGPSLTRAA
jgi:hypothetical protein